MQAVLRQFIDLNRIISRSFDRIICEKYKLDGNDFFIQQFVPANLREGLTIYDIGGGKNPFISHERKKALKLKVIGFDIDRCELERAPVGAYDKTVCADITTFKGECDADLVICQALLEHVKSVDKSFAAIASILKPGGLALVFVPSRNALYARLNLLLPEGVKRWLLQAAYPTSCESRGFTSYYDQCTPRDFRRLAVKHNLFVEQERLHYVSSYFEIFFPLYILWRIWVIGFHALAGGQAAETFCVALRKQP